MKLAVQYIVVYTLLRMQCPLKVCVLRLSVTLFMLRIVLDQNHFVRGSI